MESNENTRALDMNSLNDQQGSDNFQGGDTVGHVCKATLGGSMNRDNAKDFLELLVSGKFDPGKFELTDESLGKLIRKATLLNNQLGI